MRTTRWDGAAQRLRGVFCLDSPLGMLPIVALGAVLTAFLFVSPPADDTSLAESVKAARGAVILGIASVLTLTLSSNALLTISILVFGTLQLTNEYPLGVGPVTVYSSDILIGLLLLRAASAQDRLPRAHRFTTATTLLVVTWIATMAISALRGVLAGTPPDTIVRLGTALFYWPLLYIGFSRLVREKAMSGERLLRGFVVISVGLVLYMAFTRATHRPFEGPETVGRLGEVLTSSGTVFRRDYGLSTAFIVYPLLALVAVAQLAYQRSHPVRWALLATVGIATTFVTLIRGEIYGLCVGLAVVFACSDRARSAGRGLVRTRRARAFVAIAGLVLVSVVVLTVLKPSFGAAIAERSLPGLTDQSVTAQSTSDYRIQALQVGTSVADKHPFGLGSVSNNVLGANGIDAGYLAHSAPASLLVYTGWVGFIAAILAFAALAAESFRYPAAAPSLHPAFLGILALLSVYSLSAAGLFGQVHVIGLAVLVLAVRFNLQRQQVE